MKKIALAMAIAGTLASGAAYAGNPLNIRPTAWSDEDDSRWMSMVGRDGMMPSFLAFCVNYRNGKAGRDALRKEDFTEYETVFRQMSLTDGDIKLLRSRNGSFGIGQTFMGLTCSLGYVPRVNKSFYEGAGHRWQAVLPNRFVYLTGDGEADNMRVHAWN